jgi:hypothetical protein
MKTLALAIALMLPLLTGTHAGPNEGGVLAVHGNVDGVDTDWDPCTNILLPDTCSELIPTATPDGNNVEWFLILAVREPEPLSFNTIVFGIGDYQETSCYIAHYGPCHQELEPLEIPNDRWPERYTGTSVSWHPNCLEGNLVGVYYFGVYTYAPGQIPLGDWNIPHPASFISCSPQEEDLIAAFGTIGCGGADGENSCPASSLPDDSDIGETGGESTTWGRIKTVYR